MRRITVPRGEMVFLKNVVEASEGIGFIVAQSGGEAFVMSPKSQVVELDRLLLDLSLEIDLRIWQEFDQQELDRLTR